MEAPKTPSSLDLSLEDQTSENESEFTKDGSVDVFGNPARRSTTGGWKSAKFVLGYQALGTITYFGVSTNLVLYLMKSLHLSNGAAANAATNWVGTSYATALIGAFLGDAYLGRYWASVLFVAIHFLGTLLLTLQAAVPALNPYSCSKTTGTCSTPSSGKIAFLYVALYISALGAGGHQPCMSALGADQFEDGYPPESKKKSSFFSYFLVSSLLGSLFVTIVLSYVEERHSYAIGFGVATFAIGVAGFLFIAGLTRYRHFKPGGNPLSRAAQVFVAATRKWKARVPSDHSLLYESTSGRTRILHSHSLRFLDKAATLTGEESNTPPDRWTLCTVTQVEEVKRLILMVPLWISACFYEMVGAQVTTTFVEQGAVMNTRIGKINVSPASLYTFYTIAVIVCTVLYEMLMVPFLRKRTGNERGITMLQRMGVGCMVMTASMMVAAGTENRRLRIVRDHHLVNDSSTTVPMSVFWQVPQYLLGGIAEVFTYVAQTEFFYDQSPEGVRGLGSALCLASVAAGNYMSTLMVTTLNHYTGRGIQPEWLPENLNQGRLDLFFWMMAAISGLNFCYFLLCAVKYKYITVSKQTE